MKLIVGVGNPGRKYEGTRHNVGFEVLDDAGAAGTGWTGSRRPAEALIAKWRPASALLAKPLTFVNLSGQAVGELMRFYKIDARGRARHRRRHQPASSGGCGRGRRVRQAATTA